MPSPAQPIDQLAFEQRHLDAVVRRRDDLIDEFFARDDEPSRQRARELTAVSDGLVFGRIDTTANDQWRIGRIGIRDSDGDPLVLDWRAPVARPFYTATAADSQGLQSRRHIRSDAHIVTGVDDESFTGDSAGLVGEAALLRALDARRSGQMSEIVSTLQSEQDAVVRADPKDCLVVQGGPGTGKTAVALHRAAYLLFTHDRIARRGVLIIGPNARFLDYIGQVLPSLGETQVVQLSPATMLPGIVATDDEPSLAVEVKGRGVWAEILSRAVAERRPEPAALRVDWSGTTIEVDAAHMRAIIARIEATDDPLHVQRERYVESIIDELASAVRAESARALADVEAGLEDLLATVDRALAKDQSHAVRRSDVSGADVDGQLNASAAESIAGSLVGEPEVADAMARIWPPVDPQEVLAALLADAEQLAELTLELTAEERDAVRRDSALAVSDQQGWTTADVALLDELAAIVGAPANLGPHELPKGAPFSTRAAADRTWAYGHVIVDEAQELSAMQWRALARRCPALSFTVVGDVNQTASPSGATSWSEALTPVFGSRFRESHLTICYRTPREVIDLTPPVLAAAGSTVEPPEAARSNGIMPRRVEAAPGALVETARAFVAELAASYSDGQVAVIWPDGSAPTQPSPPPRSLHNPAEIVEVTASQAKGLEFDAVVLVDPQRIVAGERGWNTLYVALTRCTQELVVVSAEPWLPELVIPLVERVEASA